MTKRVDNRPQVLKVKEVCMFSLEKKSLRENIKAAFKMEKCCSPWPQRASHEIVVLNYN